jgi:hypothetical protein
MLSQYLDGSDLNQNYIERDLVSTKFIYPMHDMNDILFLEKVRNLNMDGVRDRPRKGIYNLNTGGIKAFNNPTQTESGINGMTEFEKDDFCKDRYIFVTLTSLSGEQSLDVKMSANVFSKYPVVRGFFGSASSLQVMSVGLAVCLMNLIFQ